MYLKHIFTYSIVFSLIKYLTYWEKLLITNSFLFLL